MDPALPVPLSGYFPPTWPELQKSIMVSNKGAGIHSQTALESDLSSK